MLAMKALLRSAALCVVGLRAFALDVVERDGQFSVLRDGSPIVTGISVDCGGMGRDDVRASFAEMDDGSKVWNRWSEVRDRRFRLEVAKRADSAVEISMSAQMEPSCTNGRRLLEIVLEDSAFKGSPYEAVTGDIVRFVSEKGVFDSREQNP